MRKISENEIELEMEHGGTLASFLDFDISILKDIFVYRLYGNRDNYFFHFYSASND